MIRKIKIYLLFILIVFTFSMTVASEGKKNQDNLTGCENLFITALEKGYVKLILKLDVKNIDQLTEHSRQYKTIIPGRKFPGAGFHADKALEQAIQKVVSSVLNRLNGGGYRINHKYSTLPYLALDAAPEVLNELLSFPEVLEIYEDRPHRLIDFRDSITSSKKPLENPFTSADEDSPKLNSSINLVGADHAWRRGYTGRGWYVAILDTGIRRTHQFFQGKTILEACFSANHDCPNGDTSMIGSGAAAHYESTYAGYDHGTHTAGIAAGKYGNLAGVAKNSNIIAVQVFSRFGPEYCGDESCVLSYDSDQVKGLEYVYSLRGTYSIAAVNMSLGGGLYSSYCNDEPQAAAIDNLKSVGIATVIATGNDGYCAYISSPACISSAVAVGASDDNDVEAYFNNWHESLQELFAPGVSIYSSAGDSDASYQERSGTSFATPHVTGAWALLCQANPIASVDQIFNALKNTGLPITTLCLSGGTCPRIQVDEALKLLVAPPAVEITLSRTQLNFSAISGHAGTVTGSQVIWINNSGTETLNWKAETGSSWVNCTPTSGKNAGVLTISVDSSGLTEGEYQSRIIVSDPNAFNSPQEININMNVIPFSQDQPPFGEFATPANDSTVCSSIPVTGWILDDIEVESVKIYIDGTYIASAIFAEGARPDVEQSFPGYPRNHMAGWGYCFLTNTLTDGTYLVNVIATDITGHLISLGSRRITINNCNAKKPFGTIDVPTQGGSTSGTRFRTLGWALTPQPNKIPEDGSTIKVYIDGKCQGHASYNLYRADIASLFAGYANSNGAQAIFDFDTTSFPNGVHTFQWIITDNAGNTDGIGSRYFIIQNIGSNSARKSTVSNSSADCLGSVSGQKILHLPREDFTPIKMKTGFNESKESKEIFPDNQGNITIVIRELERLEIDMGQPIRSGFQVVGNQSRALPIGSTFEPRNGKFYWQPGPAFVGNYLFVFTDKATNILRKINIKILPKYK